MINLLVRDKGLAEIEQKYKGRVQAVTVAVAVGYLLAVAASAGWWVWVTGRNVKAVKERDKLIQQLGQQAATEAVVRQAAARVEIVESALAGPKWGPVLARALQEAQKQGLEIVGWQERGVTVRGTNLQTLESFANGLEVKSVTKKSDGVWVQEVVWK